MPSQRAEMNFHSVRAEYDRLVLVRLVWVVLSFVLLLLVSLYTVTVGTADIALSDVWRAVWNSFLAGGLTLEQRIIMLLRLPRVALAVVAGAGLSLCGSIMQGITRNPLVSPFTIGISSAAAFGASLAIVFGIGLYTHTRYGIVLSAFLCALACAVLVYHIAQRVGLTPETLILTGIAMNYLFSAFTATIHFFAQEHQLAFAVAWTFGSLNAAKWSQVALISLIMGGSLPILYRRAWVFNAMASNDDEVVKGLGVNPALHRSSSGIITVLLTAAIISFTGVIGFVGLVGPHIARLVIGSDYRFLVPFSAITGAMLLVIADTLGRIVLAPVSIPVGIVVSYLGVPLFVNLVMTRRKGYFQ